MSFGETTPPVIRHLLLCQDVKYDFNNVTAPYSLQGIVTTHRPKLDDRSQVLGDVLWVFAQCFGDPGEYELWIDFVQVDEDRNDVDEETSFGPWTLIIHDDVYVESRAWRIRNIPFRESGIYEFRLRCGTDILAREELLLVEE